MSFILLKNTELLDLLQQKSSDERKLSLEIIELLEEVERRSLHLKKGYGSILEFCIKELKYSESTAYKKISAMRITKELPHIKDSLKSGTLNLVNITKASTFFRQERKHNLKIYSKSEKLELFKQLENKSKREVEKILITSSPELPKPEVLKQVSINQTRLTLTLDESLLNQLDLLKSKYSHINVSPNYAELIQLIVDELLRKEAELAKKAAFKVEEKLKAATISQHNAKSPVRKSNERRYVSPSVRRFIFTRDNYCCSYHDPVTQRKCSSRFQLEVDHIQAFSNGGTSDIGNLRLVCRQHNQYYWREVQSK